MNISTAKEKLIEARDYIRVANENMNNADLFDLNIQKATDITTEIKDKKLFLNDVDKIIDDISILKKQYD
jgi:tRNA A58 N-methylase Trm61